MSKVFVFIIMLSFYGCSNTPLCNSEQVANNARWVEKQRWANYQLDVKDSIVLSIQAKVLSGQISITEGFIQMSDIAIDMTPFYK
jgi:hypothetical protein